MKPTFLFLMYNGSMLSIAMRVKREGYPIKIWLSPEATKVDGNESGGAKMGEGIIDKNEWVKDFWEVISKKKPEELVIIVDDNGGGYSVDMLRKLGYKVVGGGTFVDKIEHERTYGNDIALEIGLKLPRTYEFSSLNLAIAFCRTQEEETKFVFKAEGAEFAGSSKTYTSKNMTDLTAYLMWLREDCRKKHYQFEKFELQTFVEGKEADFSAWFNGEHFVSGSTCLCFEQKKVGDSEYKVGVGQASGCMGQALFFIEKSKYFDTYIKKLEPLLKEKGYVGQIAINNIMEEKSGDPYFLEFTPRFGYDSFFSEMALRQENGWSIAKFFINLLERKPIQFDYSHISVGVRIYCCSPGTENKEVAGRFFTIEEEIEPNLWFYGVSRDDDTYLIENGVVMVACVVKDTLKAALKDIYENVIQKINLSDIYYRSQIGKGVPETVKFLKDKGWL